ncbi:MAG: DUF1553 domain-containing protein [Planctomycetales bacterium]|nr:DUF1553 domain-containing protein [Planctomycetales bacterium]
MSQLIRKGRFGACWQRVLASVAIGLSLCCTLAGEEIEAVDNGEADSWYRKEIAPLIERHCTACHGSDSQEGELRLDSLAGFQKGGKSGQPVIPFQPSESLFLAALRYEDESLQMPPEAKLKDDEIRLFEKWIADGAPHSEGRIELAPIAPPFDIEEARRFWSLSSVVSPGIPATGNQNWGANPLDAFISAKHTSLELEPSQVADKRTLIRRATFDLIGLPPSPEEVSDFLDDQSPNAFETVVNRLLASPRYGERWGRHWLDVARYADSNGLDENVALGNAYRFRDYVVTAFNADKPFDQFAREQLAGDLLVEPTMSEERRIELLTATGFLVLGPKVLAEADKTKMLMDILDEQIQTTGQAFLGQTFGCARCHDHKFDPISQADYYAMLGIFKSTHTMESLKTIAKWHENVVATAAEQSCYDEQSAKVEQQKQSIANLLSTAKLGLPEGTGDEAVEKQLSEEQQKQLTAAREQLKVLEASIPILPTAMGVQEDIPIAARINLRGSHLSLGRIVPRGVPVVLQYDGKLQIDENQSGRLQFAEWLSAHSNPLTARVIVNRVWRWHFGTGLVQSTDNFGRLGELPSNGELLDWLTSEFVRQDWSIKHLHRTIMLSKTWQLSSTGCNANEQQDAENRYYWRANEQRLEAESLRDAWLSASGQLDLAMGGSMLHVGNREFLFDHTSKDETKYDSPRRSIYLPVIRNHLYDGFALFDCTDAAISGSNRSTSTVASQALFMMNGDLLMKCADGLARQILQSCNDDKERIRLLFERVLNRTPDQQEVNWVLDSLADLKGNLASGEEADFFTWSAVCQSLLVANEFVYVQ